MGGMEDSWTTIESDPGVFTELITEMGVKGVQLEELYTLDRESLKALEPVHGLIFLFKWRAERDQRQPDANTDNKVFFAQQVITNACATQALLSVLLNCPSIDIGTELTQLKQFTAEFTPEMKGLAIGNSESIRRAHNSFTPPQPIVPDEARKAEKDDDVYHFITYVPVEGVLYELDGLKPGPLRLAECTEEDWLDKVCPHIDERIQKYSQEEIRFNLMAVIENRQDMYERQLKEVEQQHAALEARLQGHNEAEGSAMDTDETPEALQERLAALDQETNRLLELKQQAHDKFQQWHDENIRRKHNYIPFVFNFLKLLAEKGQLQPLIQAARAKTQQQGT